MSRGTLWATENQDASGFSARESGTLLPHENGPQGVLTRITLLLRSVEPPRTPGAVAGGRPVGHGAGAECSTGLEREKRLQQPGNQALVLQRCIQTREA